MLLSNRRRAVAFQPAHNTARTAADAWSALESTLTLHAEHAEQRHRTTWANHTRCTTPAQLRTATTRGRRAALPEHPPF